MHDGCGFVNHHTALSMAFEASLQAVDCATALPYWDYSIDVEKVYAENAGDFGAFTDASVNPLWSSEWFGTVSSGDNASAVIVADSRWAYTPVERVGVKGEALFTHNSYGYLRAPWNNNPVPFVTRSNTMRSTENRCPKTTHTGLVVRDIFFCDSIRSRVF